VNAAPTPEQGRAARLAGLLYILTNFSAAFGFYARSQVFVAGNPVATAANLQRLEPLYRVGIVTEIVTVAAVLALVQSLYAVLEPVNPQVSRLALIWRLTENLLLAAIPLASIAALALAGSPAGESSLVDAAMRTHYAGFNFGFLFLGLGSAAFSFVWYQSRYIPRVIAGWGVFASLTMALCSAAAIAAPQVVKALGMTYMAPMGLYEFGLGLWLLIVGLRRTPADAGRAHDRIG
jgi:hypothetical protein